MGYQGALLCFFINSTVKLSKTHKTGNTTTTLHTRLIFQKTKHTLLICISNLLIETLSIVCRNILLLHSQHWQNAYLFQHITRTVQSFSNFRFDNLAMKGKKLQFFRFLDDKCINHYQSEFYLIQYVLIDTKHNQFCLN